MMFYVALLGIVVLMGGFACIWAIETRVKLIMTPLVVVAAYMGIRVFPAMVYAGTESGLSNWLPYGVALCAGLSFVLGYALINRLVSQGRPVELGRLQNPASPDSVMATTVLGTMLLNTALGLYLFGGIPPVTVALIGLIGGEEFGAIASGMAEARASITKGHIFGGAYRGQGLVRELIAYAWPFSVLLSSYCFRITRKRIFLVLALLGFIASFVFIAGDGTRAPFLNTVIIYMIGSSLLKPLRVRHAVVATGLVMCLGILVSLYTNKAVLFMSEESPAAAAFQSIGKRIVFANAVNDAYAIDLIDRGVIDHRDGQLHIRDFRASVPGLSAPPPFAFELFQIMLSGRGTTYLTGTYLTKTFLDFRIGGVVFMYFLLGVIASAVFRWLMRFGRSPVNLAVTALAIHALAQMILGSGVITLGPSAIVIAMCLSIYWLALLAAQSLYIAHHGGAAIATKSVFS